MIDWIGTECYVNAGESCPRVPVMPFSGVRWYASELVY